MLNLQDHIETQNDIDKDLLENLMGKKINMITLQHIFRPQRQTLSEFKMILKKFLHTDKDDVEDARLYVEDLDAKLDKILDNVSLNYESLKSLAETYSSLIDLQTNKTISRLTIVTVATGFMAVVAGLFGMNVVIPGGDYPEMFWIIVVLSTLSIIC